MLEKYWRRLRGEVLQKGYKLAGVDVFRWMDS
jgi:hypothetical protein